MTGHDLGTQVKFLIDECLSPSLADIAINAGYVQSAHVTRRGMNGWSDTKIMERVLAEDWTLVTQNADDFRPRPGSTSQAPCYLGAPLHAGLVCFNLQSDEQQKNQKTYFQAALKKLGRKVDLTNKIVEIWPDADGIYIDQYDFPVD